MQRINKYKIGERVLIFGYIRAIIEKVHIRDRCVYYDICAGSFVCEIMEQYIDPYNDEEDV